jgi:hypothetical protein
MVGIESLFFVIADIARARFVRPGPDNSLHTVRVVDSITVAHRDTGPEAGTVPPPDAGPDLGPNSGADSGLVRFASLLAQSINNDFAVDLFDGLVLVAEEEVLNAVLAMLDGPTSASLKGSLARNLIDVPDLELWPHLRSWARPDDGV